MGQALLEAGADATATDKDGRTAADLARARGQPSEEQVAMLDEAVAAAKVAAGFEYTSPGARHL